MPVDVRSQRAFGVIGVNHAHIVEAQQSIRFTDHMLQSGGVRDIETAGQQMASVQAESDRHVGQFGREFAHHMQLFETPSKLRARADRVLDQEH